ncbi:MAG: type II toxin-antitoxin system RelE/ParE family toxin [Anaerolineae bacterium]
MKPTPGRRSRQSWPGRTLSYKIEVERRAQRELTRLPKQDQSRVVTAIEALTENPRPPGCLPVRVAPKGTYRIRVGDYRVIYVVLDTDRVIVIARIARRSERTYRNL